MKKKCPKQPRHFPWKEDHWYAPCPKIKPHLKKFLCRNPTLKQVWGWDSHSQKWELGVLRDSCNFRARLQRSKHLALMCYLYHWKRPWSVDVENGLTWTIWTSAAQVMVKRRVVSHIGNLTPDHKKLGIDPIPVRVDGVQHTIGKLLKRATNFL